ncbi:DUF1523 family protein [Paracoccus fistulariae]|uniref:DUF1523 family protein n=1 Tax=Paracoccus fistulariae TaxID=658446 RepID=A0ABY7SL70_9RHOB|nr:DUF1523 family protein [Paracoccus fistulariae]MDB6181992.1 DUF1523 family protein [Paracoccus fistulariae]WCR06772.1 DUF1523 family protein [Paracoccus fistulariae]
MYYVKVFLGVLLGVVVFMFLDYTLPSKNTVRITNTYNRLTAITPTNSIFYASDDAGTVENTQGQRDIRFIETVRPNGKVFVYRNEDTGWIWPPYFKYDSSNLQAEATNLRSDSRDPQWVSVTAYGWRIAWLSSYPNAISIDTLAGPNERPLNWAALIILALLFIFLVLIWRMWNQFIERTVEPAIEAADAQWEEATARRRSFFDRLKGTGR